MSYSKMVIYDKTTLERERILKILSGGKWDFLLPLNIAENEDYCKIKYDSKGYIKLKLVENLNSWEFLDIMEMIFIGVEEGKNFMIYPHEYTISTDTIYIRRNNTCNIDVRLKFICNDFGNSENPFEILFSTLQKKFKDNGMYALDDIEKFTYLTEHDLPQIIKKIDKIKQDVKAWCDV